MSGSAGPGYDERLWKRFKAESDQFHQRRLEHLAEVERFNAIKAAAKEQLITEAQKLSSISDYRVAEREYADLVARWREAGHAGSHEESLWGAIHRSKAGDV